jgi:hypothetical protein
VERIVETAAYDRRAGTADAAQLAVDPRPTRVMANHRAPSNSP